MPKELIVSVNGREKKIAIIENGQVTEFYIERGENSQGIVGNIYKGRVMRVLPGMQSAFVDIGLERDAFLYVSDFFDEEEEFERIVVDKTKSEGVDTAAATRAAQERIERVRLERERQMETAQERAEPVLKADEVTGAGDLAFDEPFAAPDDEAESDDEILTSPADASSDAAAADSEAGSRRNRRNRRRGRGGAGAESSLPDRTDTEIRSGAQHSAGKEDRLSARATAVAREELATPFSVGASSFQRIVDEDEAAAAEEGEMFKDARLQERLFDQIHAIEFDIEDVPTAEVGSLLSEGGSPRDPSFQRIDDGDIDSGRGAYREVSSVQQPVAASIARLVDVLEEESISAVTAANDLQRVSDDEREPEGTTAAAAATTNASSSDAAAADSTSGGKRTRSRRGSRQAASATAEEGTTAATPRTKTTNSVDAEDAGEQQQQQQADSTDEAPKKKRGSRARATTTDTAAPKKSSSTAAAGGRSKRAKGATSSPTESAATPPEITSETDQEAERNTAGEPLEDAAASLTSTRRRGEFARRGGRRRRRGEKSPAESASAEERTNGGSEDAEVITEPDEVVTDAAAPPAPEQSAPKGRAARSDGSRTGRSDGEGRGPRSDGSRAGGRSDSGRGASRGGDRRERQQPTITDLLREGQEIIVQIAKEPISQKGARITSHIALPGRFLVYMPTIEHVGVSRKIESDAERTRLRKLIQAITKEEDVPSGGFIVRTAGVGMSEADLRDDARYLVRTWRDIRRAAEKAKAPALAHRDLDLVQRILRDQLSEDFTAIRVDSEEEYLAIVEFVNRIQPRLVNRVKLYTREAPILEAYGVQAEIDKAIKPRVWLRSGGYLVINQTEALVAIDVNTGKFVGRGGNRLEDTITRTNLEAVDEIARQIRLRDLGGIIVLDLIDMEERRNRHRVMQALQEALRNDKSPTKVLSFNDFGLVIMTRKRVKQSLERTLCSPCPYCQGSSLVKSPQTVCYEILDEARRLARGLEGEPNKQPTLRVNAEVARVLRSTERDVLTEIEEYLGSVDITSDEQIHQEQFDFAFI